MRLRPLILALCAALPAAAAPAAPPPTIKLLNVPVPMRDGVRLSANVFLPPGQERVPVLLERTPYGKGAVISAAYQYFVDRGYGVVMQDVRGRYASAGVFEPLTQEIGDGEDTLAWIGRQPWCDGKIGMIGGSYRGIAQWKAALSKSPYLKAIFPVVSGWDDYRDRFYSKGGAMKLGYRLEWMAENLRAPNFVPDFGKYVLHLPLATADVAATGRSATIYRDAVEHPSFDSFWRAISTRQSITEVRVPVFSVGGWYDNFVESDLDAYTALHRAEGTNRALIGPWPHDMSKTFSGVDYGPQAMAPVRRLQLAWFDRWLKGKDSPLLSGPPLRIFVMGSNAWRSESEWPPAEARTRELYLESGGLANSLDGNGALEFERETSGAAADNFTYDPRNPVRTRGGAVCCNPKVFPWGPMDQRPVEKRKDVLVYTTATLKEDIEAIGPVRAVLYVSTTAPDTDFTAKLVDVFPNGMARNISDGILRLRYRRSLERPQLAQPGQVYKIVIEAGVTANVFLKGHRIRLEVSSSNFPRFDRNPNTGTPVAGETRLVKATQTVYHDREHPSRLQLMVMPTSPRETPGGAPPPVQEVPGPTAFRSGSQARAMPPDRVN